ncbi:hypothetical protein MMC07_005942 [Pseudocyphellaria aurata]|nr:hypothetical protein [Pseudocyphellaria aurata]
MAFTDKTRLDDFAPTPQYREVVVSLFYPMGIRKDKEKVQSQSATNYLPYSTARFYDAQLMALGLPPGSAERIFTHSQTNGPFFPTSRQPLPLLVFSPGYGATFHLYTAMLQEIARKGYAVAAIDHPYDADFVEFPNGKTVRGANRTTDHNLTEFLTPRLRDISLVLNELARPAPSHPIPVNTHNVIAFGHSLGGDTAVEVMLHDSRVQGGLNFDGNFNGKLNSSDCAISRPVLLIRTKAVSNKINWNDVWEKFVGWKVELTVSNTTHNSFSDLPLLADALGLRSVLHRMGNITMGDLGGLKGLDIMSSYVTAFANFIFVGDDRGSLKSKVGKSFAEVEFVRKGGPQRDADISSY